MISLLRLSFAEDQLWELLSQGRAVCPREGKSHHFGKQSQFEKIVLVCISLNTTPASRGSVLQTLSLWLICLLFIGYSFGHHNLEPFPTVKCNPLGHLLLVPRGSQMFLWAHRKTELSWRTTLHDKKLSKLSERLDCFSEIINW